MDQRVYPLREQAGEYIREQYQEQCFQKYLSVASGKIIPHHNRYYRRESACRNIFSRYISGQCRYNDTSWKKEFQVRFMKYSVVCPENKAVYCKMEKVGMYKAVCENSPPRRVCGNGQTFNRKEERKAPYNEQNYYDWHFLLDL